MSKMFKIQNFQNRIQSWTIMDRKKVINAFYLYVNKKIINAFSVLKTRQDSILNREVGTRQGSADRQNQDRVAPCETNRFWSVDPWFTRFNFCMIFNWCTLFSLSNLSAEKLRLFTTEVSDKESSWRYSIVVWKRS